MHIAKPHDILIFKFRTHDFRLRSQHADAVPQVNPQLHGSPGQCDGQKVTCRRVLVPTRVEQQSAIRMCPHLHINTCLALQGHGRKLHVRVSAVEERVAYTDICNQMKRLVL